MNCAAIIVAGGRGERAGASGPKQLRTLLGRPMLAWSLDTLARHTAIRQIILVVPAGTQDAYRAWTGPGVRIVAGGQTRAGSVRAGLAGLEGVTASHVLIHDAARPGLTAGVIDRLVEALARHDAAAPALPVVDALKRRDGDALTNVSREGLIRVQTPQAFRRDLIETALAQAGADIVDDLQAVEALGTEVAIVEGAERLAKVTYPGDFALMEQLMSRHAPPRIGKGFDVHAFGPGDSVTLCGVEVAHSHGLVGHSDADVGWHALTDAIFGALALGDLGDHFPPSDDRWKGADSGVFLAEALRLAREMLFQRRRARGKGVES